MNNRYFISIIANISLNKIKYYIFYFLLLDLIQSFQIEFNLLKLIIFFPSDNKMMKIFKAIIKICYHKYILPLIRIL
jgi:hypothetical protein